MKDTLENYSLEVFSSKGTNQPFAGGRGCIGSVALIQNLEKGSEKEEKRR